MRPTAGTTVRVIVPTDFSDDTLQIQAQQMIADYLPPRAWWAYRVTVEIKRSEVVA